MSHSVLTIMTVLAGVVQVHGVHGVCKYIIVGQTKKESQAQFTECGEINYQTLMKLKWLYLHIYLFPSILSHVSFIRLMVLHRSLDSHINLIFSL